MMNSKEDAMLKPSHHYEARLDFEVGDIVQVVRYKGKYRGRIGLIIGKTLRLNGDKILYTVQFSNKESVAVSGYGLSFLSRNDTENAFDPNR